jgi:hypothetical protein
VVQLRIFVVDGGEEGGELRAVEQFQPRSHGSAAIRMLRSPCSPSWILEAEEDFCRRSIQTNELRFLFCSRSFGVFPNLRRSAPALSILEVFRISEIPPVSLSSKALFLQSEKKQFKSSVSAVWEETVSKALFLQSEKKQLKSSVSAVWKETVQNLQKLLWSLRNRSKPCFFRGNFSKYPPFLAAQKLCFCSLRRNCSKALFLQSEKKQFKTFRNRSKPCFFRGNFFLGLSSVLLRRNSSKPSEAFEVWETIQNLAFQRVIFPWVFLLLVTFSRWVADLESSFGERK